MSEAYDKIKKLKVAAGRSVSVQLDAQVQTEQRRLRDVYAAASATAGTVPVDKVDEAAAAQKAVNAAAKAMKQHDEKSKATQQKFSFVAVPYSQMEALIALHQPSADELKVNKFAPFKQEAFFAPFMAMTCTEPALTVDDWEDIKNEWSRGEVDKLFDLSYNLQTDKTRITPFLDTGSDTTTGSE